MNPKAIIPLIAGLGIAGTAAYLGINQLRSAQGAGGPTVTLWAPSQPLSRGSAVTEAQLAPLEFPESLAPPGAMRDKTNIIGRIPHANVPAGVPMLKSMLLQPGARPGIIVPLGFRALAVKIDESSGVDNHLQPGCYVDVIGLFNVQTDRKRTTIAKTVLENVQVAAVGTKLAPSSPNTNNPGDQKKGRAAKPARAVTLLVRPEDAPKLHLAEQRGKIKLSMRSNTDAKGFVSTGGSSIGEDDVIGLKPPAPEPTESGPTFGDKLVGWLDSTFKKSEATEPPAVVRADPEPERPQVEYAWKMTVYNGDDRTLLGWTAGNMRDAITIESNSSNVFDEPWKPEKKRGPKPKSGGESHDKTDKGSGRGSTDDLFDDPNTSDDDPQELFENE